MSTVRLTYQKDYRREIFNEWNIDIVKDWPLTELSIYVIYLYQVVEKMMPEKDWLLELLNNNTWQPYKYLL